METVENKFMYHINRNTGINSYPLKIGDTIDTKNNYNPFRLSYEYGFASTANLEGAVTMYWRFAKEYEIERTRMLINTELPSRWHSLWLCEREDLPYWENQFSNSEYQLIKFKLNGRLFIGDSHWIEAQPAPLVEVRKKATHYWQGEIFRPGKMEYIFEGIAEVVEILGE